MSVRSPSFSQRALVLVLTCVSPFTVQAFQFSNEAGDVNGGFDTTISLGAAFRAQSRDPALVAITNGGTSRDINSDDGNLLYDSGDAYSAAAKVTHDLELKYKNYGAFFRGTYFHDFVLNNKDTSAASGFNEAAKDRVDNDITLLDAFVYGSFHSFGERNLNVRLGQQVVSWGESTFLLNGINIINPVDVSKLRIPGSELKEALLPTPLLWASQDLSDDISLEGFYIFHSGKTKLDPRGTYFSTTDALSDGGERIFVGAGRRVDQHGPATAFTPAAFNAPLWAPRTLDRDADNGGEYGLALHSLFPDLNNTELGLFFINYHSRTPLLSAVRGAATVASVAPPLTIADPGCASSNLINFNVLLDSSNPNNLNPLGQGLCTGARAATYFAEYPEDIRLYGLSFSTSGPAGIALQGEYSYRQNQPLQLATTEVILAAGGLANNITGGDTAAAAVVPGAEISGFRRVKMQQVQVTATKIFGPSFGAESLTAIGEIGYTHLHLPAGLLFAGPGVVLPATGSSTATTAGSTQPNNEGYATSNSWGYRLAANLSYPSAFAGVSVTPRAAFAHDVDGVSPTFNEGTKAATLGVGFVYRQKWQADLSYTTFWGGRTYAGTDPLATGTQPRTYATSANPLKDRDFISLSVSYSF
jgi:hypothetical protein